ncbi:MAG: hypothetical protein HQK53_13970 [Oligoflexia bacterium]|nr:hypothetical protein [Oligoflexia bacterium]
MPSGITPEETINEVLPIKEKIIELLPPTEQLAEELYASLQASYKEYPDSKHDDYGIIMGELFERLISVENELVDIRTGKEREVAKTETERRVDSKLTAFLKNREIFGYKKNVHRNPDLAIIETTQGDRIVNIVGDAEAKATTKLDKRCFTQFKYFWEAAINAKIFLNSRNDTQYHGLSEFGPRGKKIQVVEKAKYQHFLIIPAGSNWDINEIENHFKIKSESSNDPKELDETDVLLFKKMFTDGIIQIRESSIGRPEIEKLMRKIMPHIKKMVDASIIKAEQESK